MTKLPTLEEFLARSATTGIRAASYVKYPGFRSLYVRYGPRYLADHSTWYYMVDLANMTARAPGKGAFSSMTTWLSGQYPTLGIFVENVLTERFAEALEHRRGFTKDQTNLGCYYLLTASTEVVHSKTEGRL